MNAIVLAATLTILSGITYLLITTWHPACDGTARCPCTTCAPLRDAAIRAARDAIQDTALTRWDQFMATVHAVQAMDDYSPHEPCPDCYITDQVFEPCLIHDDTYWALVEVKEGLA